MWIIIQHDGTDFSKCVEAGNYAEFFVMKISSHQKESSLAAKWSWSAI